MRLSGSVSVTVGGETAVIKSRRERRRPARLAAAGGHIVSGSADRRSLAWRTTAQGARGLQVTSPICVARSNPVARRALLLRFLAQRRARLCPATARRQAVDLWRFEDLVGCPESDVGIRHTRLTEALELWQGVPFGPHAEARDWARGEVARLLELRLAATVAIASTALELGRDAEACPRFPACSRCTRPGGTLPSDGPRAIPTQLPGASTSDFAQRCASILRTNSASTYSTALRSRIGYFAR